MIYFLCGIIAGLWVTGALVVKELLMYFNDEEGRLDFYEYVIIAMWPIAVITFIYNMTIKD